MPPLPHVAKTPYRYWSRQRIEPNEVSHIHTVLFLKPRRLTLQSEASAIQATAYALLVYIQNDLFVEAKPIMLWLQGMRNFQSGFEASLVSFHLSRGLSYYLYISIACIRIYIYIYIYIVNCIFPIYRTRY